MPKSWSSGLKADPDQPELPAHGAAKRLAIYARRFVDQRATLAEVREAWDDFLAAALAAAPPSGVDRGADRPTVVCLCGSTRFYEQFQAANYERTMRGEIVLSVGFYMHAPQGGHGEGVGHDSAEKVALDELHKRKIDLADYVLVVSDATGYFGTSTASEIRYAVAHGKPVEFAVVAAAKRAQDEGLLRALPEAKP